jgi:hypothetical protein
LVSVLFSGGEIGVGSFFRGGEIGVLFSEEKIELL